MKKHIIPSIVKRENMGSCRPYTRASENHKNVYGLELINGEYVEYKMNGVDGLPISFWKYVDELCLDSGTGVILGIIGYSDGISDSVRCPYCGYTLNAGMGESGYEYCNRCDRVYRYRKNGKFKYRTEKVSQQKIMQFIKGEENENIQMS